MHKCTVHSEKVGLLMLKWDSVAMNSSGFFYAIFHFTSYHIRLITDVHAWFILKLLVDEVWIYGDTFQSPIMKWYLPLFIVFRSLIFHSQRTVSSNLCSKPLRKFQANRLAWLLRLERKENRPLIIACCPSIVWQGSQCNKYAWSFDN